MQISRDVMRLDVDYIQIGMPASTDLATSRGLITVSVNVPLEIQDLKAGDSNCPKKCFINGGNSEIS